MFVIISWYSPKSGLSFFYVSVLSASLSSQGLQSSTKMEEWKSLVAGPL